MAENPYTAAKWEELREELEMWQRLTMKLVPELWPEPPPDQKAMTAPWWWFAGFRRDPTEPEPKIDAIQSAVLWELACEAISRDSVSAASTTLTAMKESGMLQTMLDEQAEQFERAAKSCRMKSASLARTQKAKSVA